MIAAGALAIWTWRSCNAWLNSAFHLRRFLHVSQAELERMGLHSQQYQMLHAWAACRKERLPRSQTWPSACC